MLATLRSASSELLLLSHELDEEGENSLAVGGSMRKRFDFLMSTMLHRSTQRYQSSQIRIDRLDFAMDEVHVQNASFNVPHDLDRE